LTRINPSTAWRAHPERHEFERVSHSLDRPARDLRMSRRILILQGHPDASTRHFCHALAASYADAASAAGHEVRVIEIARIPFPLLTSKAEWDEATVPASLAPAQQDIHWAQHLVIVYPLWLGGMPAVLKGFLEQVARPDFAVSRAVPDAMPRKLLKGRSARIVVTMGMPALVYRWYFGAHSLKALKRNILGFAGVAPIRETLIGSIDTMTPAQRLGWLAKLTLMGSGAN
jgi:putative NADPH-quinone reductase